MTNFFTIRLTVDGEVRDSRSMIWATQRNVPILTTRLPLSDSEIYMVEVFARLLPNMRVKICINNRQVAGESF